ncbi:MAG TPA: hypothetical protein VHM70_08665 [Polyangiaceae bacterium]|jgi:tetratricopeptide (TPR) repeat protein|nr:hypothetical protein [Polyangiaceae bacterium]
MRLSLRPSSIPPTPEELLSVAADLRAELEATELPEARALLHYEVGVLEEQHRDDHGAARDLLSAVNAASNLAEPLERLIALVERRHSFQNLGKLLDRLGRIASTPEEVVRAQLARGDFLADHRHDDEGARQAYALAEQAGTELASVWLSLELFAGKHKDRELYKRVTAARASSTHDPNYRALLRLRAARAAIAAGDERTALRLLEQLALEPHPARAAALEELERHARSQGDEPRALDLSEQRAQWLTQLLEQHEPALLSGINPESLARRATELWLRAARRRRELGDTDHALANLARAERLLGDNPAVRYELCLANAAAGNTVRMSQAVNSLLGPEPTGPGPAALLFRLADAEQAAGNLDQALAALTRALSANPECLPARALQLHLLLAGDDLAALADAWESSAAQTRDEAIRARHYTLAALCWSWSGQNPEAARAALSQAALSGLGPATAARLARLFANFTGDERWRSEAAERLLRHEGLEETASVLLEAARQEFTRGNEDRAKNLLLRLGREPDGSWLAATVAAYTGTPSAANADASNAAFSRLAELSDEATRAALHGLLAFRQLSVADRDSALPLLRELHRARPNDVISGQQLASALRAINERPESAMVSARTAELILNPELGAALLLEAGLIAWRAGEQAQAVELFQRASSRAPGPSSALLQWALCAAQPNDEQARRAALQAGLGATGDTDAFAIERFALDVVNTQDPSVATQSIDRADDVSLSESGEAVQLARALWRASTQHLAALKHVESLSALGKEVAEAARLRELWNEAHPQPAKLHQQAKVWAATGSLDGALEWLGTSLATLDLRDELLAREHIGKALGDEARTQLEAGTRLLRFLIEPELPALLEAVSPEARLCNLELAPPGCDPRRRASALGGIADSLGEENEALSLALAGQNELAAQRHDAALASFRAVLKSYPDDIVAWDGLRLAAQNLEERTTEAQACLKLGELSRDLQVQASFYRKAAGLFLDDLQDEAQGRAALARATELDIRHKPAFQRYYGLLKDAGEPRTLVALLERRIEVSNDASELAGLYWDRARSFRQLDELERALEELTNLNLLEPAHVGARALRSEIYLKQGRHQEAASELRELAAAENAPAEQRLMSGIAAVDLFETRLDDIPSALQVLENLEAAKLDTLAVLERLARTTAKAERWDDAAKLLERLIVQRKTLAGRGEAARLLLVVYRDKLLAPERAERACSAILQEAPTDAEVIDFVLDESLEEAAAEPLLTQIKAALLHAPLPDLSAEQVARIARVAEALDDLPLRQAALGSLVALGVTSQELREELAELDARAEHFPKLTLSSLASASLVDPADKGPLARLMELVGPYVNEALGPNLETLGVGRRDRVKAPGGGALRTEVLAFANAFGVAEFDLYIGGSDAQGVTVVADPKLPSIVLGHQVQAPLTQSQRARLAAQVFGLGRGTSTFVGFEAVDNAALVSAACKAADIQLEGPSFAIALEFERQLKRTLPRKVKKEIALLFEAEQLQKHDPLVWAQAARSTLDRAAAVAVGDVSWVLLRLEERLAQDRKLDPALEHRIWPLLRFVLSAKFLELRAQLGMAAR